MADNRNRNHDLTLDGSFFASNSNRWKWPEPQSPEKCQLFFQNSPSFTYLEHESATFYLESPNSPRTCFKVFGSPYSPNVGNWAFQYLPQEAAKLWDAISSDADIVVTHTPPKDHCDKATKDSRSGCEALLQALHRVRPRLSVFGHIHEARGVEIVQWNTDPPENGRVVSSVEIWEDPGRGNNKQSLISLSTKGVRSTINAAATVPRRSNASSLASSALDPRAGDQHSETLSQPGGAAVSISRRPGVADTQSEAETSALSAPARAPSAPHSDIGQRAVPENPPKRGNTHETIMVNAAYLGPRIGGRTTHYNKPIVVDIDLPVWTR